MWMNKTAEGRQEWGNDAIDGVGGGEECDGGRSIKGREGR